MSDNTQSSEAFAALKIKNFRNFQFSRWVFTMGLLMQSTIIGWQVYELTNNKLSLGLIGLSEALPFILTTFYSGYAADIFNRKKIIVLGTILIALSSFVLLWLSYHPEMLVSTGVIPIYAMIVTIGIARAFLAPATSAYHAQLLPRNLYSNGAAWGSMAWNTAAVMGPILIGFIYEQTDIHIAYMVVIAMMIAATYTAFILPSFPPSNEGAKYSFLKDFGAGLDFVRKTEAIKYSITLDLFVVLFGSVTALLPAFAKDVLDVGQTGLGFLRAAQFFGSAVTTIFLLRYSPVAKAGRNLLIAVFGFALSMIAFAFSSNVYLSIFILALSGMFDSVSVVIRSTILQLFTPDHMRGRVSAVSAIFIKSSNEIGDFESGLAASILGLRNAVIFGGAISLSIVLLVGGLSKKFRNLKT
jgi:MFS family permease